jgi:hypothetical protein
MPLELLHGIKVRTSVNNEHCSSHVNMLLYIIYVVEKKHI